jgi:methylated-DNA-[protein]-cysteine S-methyltransferase
VEPVTAEHRIAMRKRHASVYLPYGDIAKRLRKPTATRAVGAANGRNPISIVVPCHRVIGTSGKLAGFAGGLEAKAHLLNLEAAKGERSE